jgi:hypothetical protein
MYHLRRSRDGGAVTSPEMTSPEMRSPEVTRSCITKNDVTRTGTGNEKEIISRAFYVYFPRFPPVFLAFSLDSRCEKWNCESNLYRVTIALLPPMLNHFSLLNCAVSRDGVNDCIFYVCSFFVCLFAFFVNNMLLIIQTLHHNKTSSKFSKLY